MARPTKYTETLASEICRHLKTGCTRRDAFNAVGISDETFANWLKNKLGFLEQVNRAEAEVANSMTRAVVKAGNDGDWRAALEWLKRRRRDEWGDSLNLTKATDDDLVREAEEILNRQRERPSDSTRAGGVDGTKTPGADAARRETP